MLRAMRLLRNVALQRAPLDVLAAAAFAALGGCEDTVQLATECPPYMDTCVIHFDAGEVAILRPDTLGFSEDPPHQEMPAELDDAGSALGTSPNGGVDDDAGGIISAQFAALKVHNPSFERDGGVGGDLLLIDLVGLFVEVPPVLAELPHWFTCIPFSISSLSWFGRDTSATPAAQIGDYLAFNADGTAARQRLPAPMQRGATYAFEVDVLSETNGANNMFLEARGATADCRAGIVLGRSPVVADSPDWQTTCVTFRADDAYSHLLLAAHWEGKRPAYGSRLRVDGLRQVPACP
jgi:hypothetical protein